MAGGRARVVDPGHGQVRSADGVACTRRAYGSGERRVVLGGEDPRPRVEEHRRLRARLDLLDEYRRDRVRARLEQRGARSRARAKSIPLMRSEGLASRPPSTRYAASVNGAPANPISGTFRCSARTEADRLQHVGIASRASGAREAPTSSRGSAPGARSRARVELDADAHAGAAAGCPRRGSRRPRRGGATGWSVISAASSGVRQAVRNRVLRAQRAVLGQVAAGLTHDPDRRPLDRLAAAGAEEEVSATGATSGEAASSDCAQAASTVVGRRRPSCVAAERKFASNCDGGEVDPALEHGVEEAPEARGVARGRPRASRVTASGVKKSVHIEPDAGDAARGSPSRATASRDPLLEGGARRSSRP